MKGSHLVPSHSILFQQKIPISIQFDFTLIFPQQNQAKMNWVFLLVFLIYWQGVPTVVGYSRGAPDAACGNLTPRHGPVPQQTNPPFTITPLQDSVDSGAQLSIRLSSAAGNSFKGFLIQAYDASSPSTAQPLGKFLSNANGKTLSCSGNENSLTHASSTAKDQIEITWQAPGDFAGDIIFKSTFVKDYATFWVQVPSANKVRVKRTSSTTKSPLLGVLAVYDQCGKSKNCFGYPSACETSKTCDALVTYIRKGTAFEFELFGKPSSSAEGSYVAVGFSKDSAMGTDSVNECDYVNGQMSVHTSYNFEGKYNQRTDNASLINVIDSRFEDGYLYCKFSRQPVLTTSGVTFDLNQPHFLLLSKGPSSASGIDYHENRTSSSGPLDLGTLATSTSPVPTTTRTTLGQGVSTTPSTLPTANPLTPPVYQGCGKVKSCFGIPSNCVNSGSCASLVTYTRNNSLFSFELYGKAAGTSSYVAVGFSRDKKMGGDSVNECVFNGNQVNVYTSQNYNSPQKYNQRINANIVTVLDSRYENGYFYCKFTRQPVFTFEGNTYNLSQPQYLLLARGPASTNILIKVHGALMIIAWILSASCGIIVARYFRRTWVGKQVGGKDIWFVIHRIVMITVWLLTVISFIIIFVSVDGWTDTASYNPHAVIGCITTALAFIQPFMAYFRPHPGTPRRPIFNWAHWTVGNSAHILGIVCVFLAVDLGPAGLPDWMTWVLVAYVVFHAFVHLALTVLNYRQTRNNQQNSTVYAMKDLHTNGHSEAPPSNDRDAPGSKMRKILLGVYAVTVTGLTAALIAAVAKAPW